MGEIEIGAKLTNGTITTEIEGVEVAVRYGWYPGLIDPANFQWRAEVPLLDREGKVEKLELIRRTVPVREGRRYEYLKALDAKGIKAFLVAEIGARHEKVQAYHEKAPEREIAEIDDELGKRTEREARKAELEAQIAVRVEE